MSVISSQHPFNQAYTQATDTNQKGFGKLHQRNMIGIMSILLVKTVLTQNALEFELQQFWHDLADDLVQSENLTRNA